MGTDLAAALSPALPPVHIFLVNSSLEEMAVCKSFLSKLTTSETCFDKKVRIIQTSA